MNVEVIVILNQVIVAVETRWWKSQRRSVLGEGQSESCLQSGLLIDAIVHEGVVGELVSVEQVLEEVGAFIRGVSPGHGRAHGTHHFVGVVAVVVHAVFDQFLLVQVPGSTERTHEGRAVWNIAWNGLRRGDDGDKLWAVGDLFLDF